MCMVVMMIIIIIISDGDGDRNLNIANNDPVVIFKHTIINACDRFSLFQMGSGNHQNIDGKIKLVSIN
jgi:hypothetical protein